MAVVSIAVGSSVLGDAMIYAVLPSNISSFGLQVGLVGVILSVNRFIRLVSNAWASRAYRRLGIFWPFVAALTVGGFITASYAVVRGFWGLVLLRAAWGICWSFLRLGGYLTALDEGEAGTRGRLMGILNTGTRGGQLVGALLGALLADLLGHPMAFSTLAFLTGLGLVIMVFYWGPGRKLEEVPATEPSHKPYLGFIDRTTKDTAWNLLISHIPDATRQVRYRLLAVNSMRFALGFGGEGLLVSSLGLILLGVLGDEAQLGVLVLGISTVTGVLLAVRWSSDLGLSILLGHLSDRLGRGTLLAVFFPTLFFGLLVVGFADTPAPILIVLPFVFVASTAYGVVLDAAAGELAPRSSRAQVMSRYATWRDMGGALGPLLGYGVGVLIGFSWMYLLAALVFLLSGMLYLYSLWRRQRPSRAAASDGPNDRQSAGHNHEYPHHRGHP